MVPYTVSIQNIKEHLKQKLNFDANSGKELHHLCHEETIVKRHENKCTPTVVDHQHYIQRSYILEIQSGKQTCIRVTSEKFSEKTLNLMVILFRLQCLFAWETVNGN